MINDKNFKQEGGDQSTYFQGQNLNVYHGITYKDAKEIALDVFKTNFIQLKSEAAQIVRERAEEITENILNKLRDKNPEIFKEFEQPAMQDALFIAQKEFAKSGDKDLGDLLVDIIVDRASVPNRNMLQIILNESLLIASKLTIDQLDSLTLNFLLIRTKEIAITNFDEFKDYLTNNIFPFTDNLTSEYQHYNYLEYLRCGHIREGSYGQLEHNLRNMYKGLFSKGFTEEEIKMDFEDISLIESILVPFLYDSSKLQLKVLDEEGLKQSAKEIGLNEYQRNKLVTFLDKTTMSSSEIKKQLIKFDERMNKIFQIWENSSFKQFELSHVGIAIGHANYRRKTGQTMDLSMWIK